MFRKLLRGLRQGAVIVALFGGLVGLSNTIADHANVSHLLGYQGPAGGGVCPTATSNALGCVKPDNSSVTISSGVLSATAGSPTPSSIPFTPSNNILQYACGVTIGDGGNHELNSTSQCGLNTVTTLAGLAAVSVAGATPSTPYAFATNPTYGLTFSMSTTANQGAPSETLTFVCTISGVAYASLQVPCFNGYPGAQNQVVQAGMVVSGSCIANGTTVSSYSPTAGTVTLSQNSTGASGCVSGTSITFALSSTQIGELSVAYLAVEAGLYNAGQAGGGAALIPRGTYVIAPASTVCCQLIRPEGTNQSAEDTADLIGEQQGGVILKWNADLGWTRAIPNTSGLGEPCAITLPNRRSGDGYDWTRNVIFEGPGSANVNQSGTVVAYMDGLCIGSKSNVDNVFGQWFDAGLNIEDDHQTIRNSGFNNNFYGIYFASNQEIIGNQYFDRVAGVGNAWAAVAFAWNNAFNAGIMHQTDLSQTPWAMYAEKIPSTAGSSCSGTYPCGPATGAALTSSIVIGGDTLTNALAEAVTCGYFLGDGSSGPTAGWNGDTFIASQTMVSYGGSCPVSGYSTRKGVVVLAYAAANIFINADWTDAGAAFSDVTEGIFVATNNFLNNRFYEFGLTLSNIATQTIPFIYGTGGAPNAATDTWCSGGGTGGGSPANMQACGVFAGSTGTFLAGDLLKLNSSDQVLRLAAVTDTPYGVAMQGGSVGYPGLVPVATSGGAVSVNVTTAPTVGTPACPDATTVYKVGNVSSCQATESIFGIYLGSDYIDLRPVP